MKKIVIIILMGLILTGCTNKDEKKEMFYNSLGDAYKSVYITDGMGLPVLADENITLDGKVWYKVSSTKYNLIETIENMFNNVFTEEVNKELKTTLHEKYKEVDSVLYTLSTGGCMFNYQIDETLKEGLKKDVKIKKIKSSKIIFEYKGKEYTAKKDKDNYTFSEKIFVCEQ